MGRLQSLSRGQKRGEGSRKRIHILTSDPEIGVIGAVASGEDALEFLARKKPDVITMDINMHRMNGFEATHRIMGSTPLPIIIVSASW